MCGGPAAGRGGEAVKAVSTNLAWAMLVASGLADVAWAMATKKADGFQHPIWSLVSLGLLALFIGLLAKALQVLPLGKVYAVWTGIGVAGSVTVGVLVFGESASPARLACVAAIGLAIVGLRILPS